MSRPLSALLVPGMVLGLVLGLAGAAAPIVLGTDYSFFPRDPRVMERNAAVTKVTLAAAIEAASKAAPGVVASAERRSVDGRWIYEVLIYGEGRERRVVVDGASGATTVNETPAYTYPGEPLTGEWTVLPSGVWYSDLKLGTGAQPSSKSAKITVHYTGWLVDGKKFDSSHDRNQPLVWPLNQLVKGWMEAVPSMQVGGKRKLVIPAAMGYGDVGSPPTIPPRATLIFDMELLATE